MRNWRGSLLGLYRAFISPPWSPSLSLSLPECRGDVKGLKTFRFPCVSPHTRFPERRRVLVCVNATPLRPRDLLLRSSRSLAVAAIATFRRLIGVYQNEIR